MRLVESCARVGRGAPGCLKMELEIHRLDEKELMDEAILRERLHGDALV